MKIKKQNRNSKITPKELFEFLSNQEGKMSTIAGTLLHFNIIKDSVDLSSSSRSILRKARKEFNPEGEGFKSGKREYWIIKDRGKDSFDEYGTQSQLIRLIDDKEATELGYL